MSKDCIISEISRTDAVGGANPAAATETAGAIFQINSIKFYAPVVTLSINDNIMIKFLENLKQVFKRTISWNKCRSESTTQP